ncbi:PilZ domain-containing protein [Marinobacter sp.]|uniref:PilZ domain-containing protein n=1 Tax=Marinobacter sp. TaxID=50741 RepID=UPI0038503041
MREDSVNQRLSNRVAGRLELLVFRRGMPVATGKIRDASRHGFFIVTDYTDVELHQTLDIGIRLLDAPEKHFRRIKAEVARISEEGLGVEVGNSALDEAALSLMLDRFRKHDRLNLS